MLFISQCCSFSQVFFFLNLREVLNYYWYQIISFTILTKSIFSLVNNISWVLDFFFRGFIFKVIYFSSFLWGHFLRNMFCLIIFHFNTGFSLAIAFIRNFFFFKLLFEIEIHIECGLVLTNIFLYSPHPKFLIVFHGSSYYLKLIPHC